MTGGLGYLGSVAAPYLERAGYDVTILDTGFFKNSLLFDAAPARTIFKDARDISDADLHGIDAVVHLAGISNDPFGSLREEKIYDPTREYARRLAFFCKKRGARFIFASSCSVYGKGGSGLSDEDSLPDPQTAYSRNKIQIEEDLSSLADGSFSPIALRFATAFGLSPRMRFDIVINMFAGMAIAEGKIVLNSNGEGWRPNVHVEDISRAVLSALRVHYNEGRLLILNVGTEENNMKIIDIAACVSDACANVPISFLQNGAVHEGKELIQSKLIGEGGADTRTYQVSFRKIKKFFPDFSCRYSVQDGVRAMAVQFRELGLDAAAFRNPKFYRLQTIEALLKSGRIGDDLRWI